ncbi:putative protein kinase [Leptomonas pyrrhocoris]|uniref:Protein kinase domain-containing protein n=1 Tax=Leptomonas pyrrhocoris TaxID=157538 RepID=A0A0N0DYV3_LEPPY|nr:putative protein kinase [Leptomonas pyrrhocoris]KPA84585.1 putative protein kinase [Leptomonas pyrrhocoris]|eukprot:XP_015663024.1 putative protein kinase [Leptomonas pyrrhocoris]
MQPEPQSEKHNHCDDALAKLPATRWDRLVAVLEKNEPERAIDAPHILERAKKLHLTDMDLFYLLSLHYQDNMSLILLDVLSLYAMMTTWVDWIKQVQRCFSIRKGKAEGGACRPAPPPPAGGARVAADTDFALASRSGSNLGNSRHTSSLAGDSFSTGASDNNNNNTLRDSGTRNGRSRGHASVRTNRSKVGRFSHVSNIHCCFNLGPEWEWDGSLDFLRDGHVLSTLVEEALEHCGKLGDLQDDHRAHPEVLNRGTYDVLYPSLAEIDRLSKDPGGAGSTTVSSGAIAFDPISYLSSFTRSRLSRDRRGEAPASKALKLIEQQGRNLAAAEHWVTRLNGMCEHFLGWRKTVHKGEQFLDICNSDALVRPLNADDKHLLYRLHWLAVALYRTVKDPTIIPAPPRLSFIACRDDFTGVLDTSEEDNEIGLLVATKCSCLPLNTKLSVTMQNFNRIQLKHPKLISGPETLPCTLVRGETYVYYADYHVFMPIWCVLQYYIKQYDGIPWRFEPNRQERDREAQVLGKTSSDLRVRTDPSSGEYGASSSGAVFDLTVQSSTVRRGRDKNTAEQSATTRQTRNPAGPSVRGLEALASPEHRQSIPDSANLSPLSAHAAQAKNVAFATVRRNPVTAAAAASPSSSSLLAALPTPPARSPFPPPPIEASAAPAPPAHSELNPSMAATSTSNHSNVSNGEGAPLSRSTTGDQASNAISDLANSISSVMPPNCRQATTAASAMECSTQLLSTAISVGHSTFSAQNSVGADAGEGREENSNDAVAAYRASEPRRAASGENEAVEQEAAVGAAAVKVSPVITPSCTISCSPSSHVMVSRETFNYACIEEEEEYDAGAATDASAMMYSESRKMLRNFTASVVQESDRNGILILSHHFRVSGGPIGKGAFGAVYKALNLDTGRIVAVKQSRASYDDKTTDLNWREFQTWSMLPLHANVIIFYGASKEVDTHQLLLVMEYASGGSIVQLYRQFRPIPEPLFYDHACGMARGIKHLHDHNVIHGDVKPENVLTRSDGSVAITDFGCSRFSIASSDSDSSTLQPAQRDSNSWQLFGTAAYMAPEVILNEPHLKSDVWAYACTLLQLWLGKSPWSGGVRHFSAQDSVPLMFYIADEDVVPFTEEQMENSPRWLQRIAQRAFEREVDKRCTMGEVISILNEYSRAYIQ